MLKKKKTKAQLKKEFEEANTLLKLTVLALLDYDEVAKTPGYEIDMSTWYDARGDVCEVCFAGCVIANRSYAKAIGEDSIFPDDFDDDIAVKFHALNRIREGDIEGAYLRLHPEGPLLEIADLKVYPHCLDPKQWRKDMGELVKHLRKLKI